MKDLPDEITLDTTKLDINMRLVAGDVKIDNLQVVTPKNSIICVVKATRQMASQTAAAEEETAE